MTMRRPSPPALAALAAAALAGAGLSACGGDSSLIPGGRASAMEAELDRVAAGVSSGDCEAAQVALSRVQGQLVNLPRSTDPELRARLEEGVANLQQRIPAACQAAASGTEQQDRTETDTQSTDEQQTDETDTGTTTDETTPPDTDTDETQPTDTDTEPPDTGTAPPADGTGGAPAGGEGDGG